MAVDLGTLRFGLTADLRGLDGAIDKMQDFRKVIEQTAASNTKRDKQRLGGLKDQEAAMVAAIARVKELAKAVNKAGADPNITKQAVAAVDEYVNKLTQGKVRANVFAKANRDLEDTFKSLRVEAKATAGSANDLATQLRNISATATLAAGPLSGIGARIQALTSIVNGSTISLALFIAGMIAVGVAIFQVITAAINSGKEMEKLTRRMDALTGSTIASAREFAYLIDLADRAGVSFPDLANQYTRIAFAAKGTNLEGTKTRKLFEQLTMASAKFQNPAEQTERILRAIEQMMSKGNVQAEELRGQLGDSLPGAFRIAADAMGMTTAELNRALKAGEVFSDDFLPKFGNELEKRFGSAGTEPIRSFTASWNRLVNAFFNFGKVANETLLVTERGATVMDMFADAINFVSANLVTIIALLGAFAGAMAGSFLSAKLLAGVAYVGVGFTAIATALRGMAVAAIAFISTNLVGILIRVAAMALGAVAGFFAFKTALDGASGAQQTLNDKVAEYLTLMRQTRNSNRDVSQEFLDGLRKQETALKETIKSQRASLTKLKEDLQGAFRIGAEPEAIQGLEDAIKRLETSLASSEDAAAKTSIQIEELSRFITDPENFRMEDDFFGEGFDKALEKILELQDEMFNLGEKITAVNSRGGLDELLHVESLIKARDILTQLTDKGMAELNKELEAMGFNGDTAEESLAQLLTEISKMDDELGDIVRKLEKMKELPGILDEARQRISDVNAEAQAALKGKDFYEAFRDTQEVEREVRDLEKRLKEFGASEAEVTELSGQLRAGLTALKDAQRGLQGDTSGTTDKIDKQKLAVEKLFNALQSMQEQVTAIKSGSYDPLNAEAVKKARDIIDGLTDDQLVDLATKLQLAGFGAESLEQALADMLKHTDELGLMVSGFNAMTQNSLKMQIAIEGAEERIARMTMTTALMDAGVNGGAEAIARLNRHFEDKDAIEAFADSLRQAGASESEVVRQSRALEEALGQLRAKQLDVANGWEDLFAVMHDSFKSAGDEAADGLADIIVNFHSLEDALASIGSNLSNLAGTIVQEIISHFLKLAIINPILNSIFGTAYSTFANNGFNSVVPGGSPSGNVHAGPIPKARVGRVITGQQTLNTADGPVIGGEAGAEAIMPLVRNSKGELGVRSDSGGGMPPIIFNIMTPDVAGFRKAESQIGARMARLVASGGRNS
jgi:tape measure domain-containing protein